MFTAHRRGGAEVRLLLAGLQVATESRKADRIFQLSVGIHNYTSWRVYLNVRKFIVASAVGALVILVLIALVFGLLLSRFFADNMTNAEVMRMPPILWSMCVSCLAEGALICYVLGRRSEAGAGAGARTGFVIGLLMWGTANFSWYSIMNVSNLTSTIVNPLADAIIAGIAGSVIGLVVGNEKPDLAADASSVFSGNDV